MRKVIRVPPSRAGFSLIELLVASVAASILALTASTLLVLAWKSWGALQEGIEMQRDASTALIAVKHQLRSATAEEVGVTNGMLQIDTVSFYQQGTDLVFDPDIGVAGNERVLIQGRLDGFTASQTHRAGRVTLTIDLSLLGDIGHETIAVTSTVGVRN